MKKLVFATQNGNKVKEVNQLLAGLEYVHVVSLSERGIHEEIPETSDTLEGNARQKARYIFEKYDYDCFSEDTGLEVEILGNAPGVYSARYAGPQKSSRDNITKLLHDLAGQTNRNARFRTVLCLILDQKEFLFEGVVNGIITEMECGVSGFGYDPIFRPDGYDLTFAQMELVQKNAISHRGQAVNKLIDFLKKQGR
jgi:XTP/dITP diphosphohydrolase